MPYVKRPPTAEPLVKLWDRKAQKYGLHHTVYSVNGDQYTGEWMDNKKHGKGKQVWKRAGIVYDGDWRCGKRDGFGTLSRMDPETKEYTRVYVGSWRNDKKEVCLQDSQAVLMEAQAYFTEDDEKSAEITESVHKQYSP
ncbi:MORN repeat-containing protein 3 isoform X4 [Danio rerio]|uniref:MORN repeat-containing protein 3 isoform X4 n=1 Tax=Danio rerio TaxID=7955 RepID=A0AC58GK11_DANRE